MFYLKRCAEAILSHQEKYFRIGNAGLSPLSMKQIASELNIHISTVSRALINKYLHSVQGTVPLSLFFSQPATQKSQTGLGGRAAQAVLQELIAAEDKRRPLSDQKLCEIMAEQGCRLSRRTIAKYRDVMGIPGASARKNSFIIKTKEKPKN